MGRSDVNEDYPSGNSEPIAANDELSAEVGQEGGSPGDLELERTKGPAQGSEATELWQRGQDRIDEIRRDDTGEGRRSPVE
jgi:hypothetical protein